MLVKVNSGEKIQITETMDFVLVECCKCATPFLMTTRLNKSLRESEETFFCPLGHEQGYYGKNTEEKLKDEVEKLKKEKEQEYETMQNRFLDAVNEKIKIEKQLKRVHKGVCPCCNRSFVNLQQHMKTKHPEKLKI
jgi:hypothetical protein